MDLRFDQPLDRRQEPEIELSSSWMITYSDMITIMLCFFVVFFVLSANETDALQQLRARLTTQVDTLDQQVDQLKLENYRLEAEKQQLAATLFGVLPLQGDDPASREDFLAFLIENDLLDQVHLLETERGLVIRFRDGILFASGSAEISSQGVELLDRIGLKLAVMGNPVVVEGYTDNVPIRTAQFPSNWELSSARAITVAHYLINELGMGEERLSIAGFGEQNPIDTNETEAGRANNRRIEITVLTQ